ncbi:hypothetical protein SDC9_110267 [bioreactor metagenome]|uniref:Protein translocase subunit SecA n=1 Tax=bioreactor metagenome TaxID=1076179 RepID=A0A645BDI1_9ZZZZ
MNESETRSCTPLTITEDLIDLCKSNGVQDPFYVSRQPKPDCEEGDCFKNVKKYVARLGGLILVGWAITSRKNLYLECEAHAIWQSPDGENIDITPSNEYFDKTLFSYQGDMLAVKTPSKYLPFTQSTLVAEYMGLRNEFERIRCISVGDTMEIPKILMDRILEIDRIFMIEVGRNKSCPCKSGLKFKHCCGR